MLYDRHIDRERVRQYGLTLAMSGQEVIEHFATDGHSLSFDMITIPLLERARSAIIDARFCSLTHPSGPTLASWLKEIGFREVIPSHSGAWFAGRLFDQLSEEQRPKDIEGVDAILRPVIKIAVRMAAPIDTDHMITAIR